MDFERSVAVVAGVGPGLGAALCRQLAAAGYKVAGLARSAEFGTKLAREIAANGGRLLMCACDVTDGDAVAEAFLSIEQELDSPSVLCYNAGEFIAKPLIETLPGEFERLWAVNCLGAFLCAREAAARMAARQRGTIIFTGATAAVRPGAQFSAFGAAKSALRGLAQSMARELGPLGIHVVHVVVDGVIWTPRTSQIISGLREADCLQPDAIARTYLHLTEQDRSAWTQELDLRPDREPS
jgi:NAD(P)-dependent dehydrogenase (short-subunit alcohol dehydrogenase family)